MSKKNAISIEEARQRFNDYYNNRNKSKMGKFRGKMFDIMYQKKPKFVLKPGEKGSEKYMLEEGPRTFDMVGVDYFPEGTKVNISESDIEVTSRGASFYNQKMDSEIDNSEINVDKTHPHIYGPRIKESGELYNKHFKTKYDNLVKNNYYSHHTNNIDKKNLIDIYWKQYREGQHQRKNKKDKKIKSSDYSAVVYKNNIYLINDNLLSKNSGEVLLSEGNNYRKLYSNILDEEVPDGLLQAAFSEGIVSIIHGEYTITDYSKSFKDDSKDEKLFKNTLNQDILLISNITGIVQRVNINLDGELELVIGDTWETVNNYIRDNGLEDDSVLIPYDMTIDDKDYFSDEEFDVDSIQKLIEEI